MRPRHKAAENIATYDGTFTILGAASMRPRHKAAENKEALELLTAERLALQ